MANPDAYDEKYAKWNMADLPIIRSDYKYEVAKATKKQFNILKKLMNDKELIRLSMRAMQVVREKVFLDLYIIK